MMITHLLTLCTILLKQPHSLHPVWSSSMGGVNEVVLIVLTSVTDQKWIKLKTVYNTWVLFNFWSFSCEVDKESNYIIININPR
jgi:hypothetical protein